jgi:hypothetical protein
MRMGQGDGARPSFVGVGHRVDYSGARQKLGGQKRFMLFSCRDIAEASRACGQQEMYCVVYM